MRPLPDCFSFDMHDDEDAEDWNGDGRVDFVNTTFGVPLLLSGVAQPPACIATVTTTTWNGVDVAMVRSCIGDSQELTSLVADRFPGRSVYTANAGWRDFDEDGDLDLVVGLRVDDDWQTAYWYWFENTGYEASNGLAGDINRDGAIDGKDLAIVLAGWTG